MPICNPIIQLVAVNLYTKFKVSIYNGCGDIFDKKSGKKEKGTNTQKYKRRKPIFNPTIQHVIVNLYTKFEASIVNNCGDIFDEKSEEKEKKNKYREEQIGEGPFSIPRYKLLL